MNNIKVNQQEFLGNIEESFFWFLAGFIEGEASLGCYIKKNSTTKIGYAIQPEFAIYQHENGKEILEKAKHVFGHGSIKKKSGSPSVLVYVIQNRTVILTRVTPFFHKYVVPFSCKSKNLDLFENICIRLQAKEHYTKSGFIRLCQDVYKLNPGGKGKQRKLTLDQLKQEVFRDYPLDL